MNKLLALLVVLTLCITGFTTYDIVSTAEAAPDTTSAWVETTLAGMTLPEKAAQMVCIWSRGTYMANGSEDWQKLERLTEQYKIGGIVFSMGNVYDYAFHINKLQQMSRVPLLISADFEYGAGMRIAFSTVFPPAMAIGATRDTLAMYEMGLAVAAEARALGVHQNYAPTMDVNISPKNPVINARSYSDRPELVSAMGVAYLRGLQNGGVIATAKHFPGHGASEIDTHIGLATLMFPKVHFQSIEFPPFRAAIEAGVQSVMTGHLAAPAYDDDRMIPATLSHAITTDLLRNQFNFKGLIVTDALEMKAIADKYSPGDASLRAVKAGADVILVPPDPVEAIDAIVGAVRKGEILESRLDESVRRILMLKFQMNLHQNRLVDINAISSIVGSPDHQRLALQLARKAITVLGNMNRILPLRHSNGKTILDIYFSDTDDPAQFKESQRIMREEYRSIEFARIDSRSQREEYDAVLKAAKKADILLLQFHYVVRSGQMTGFMSKQQGEMVAKLQKLKKPIVGIAYGNPYVAMEFPQLDVYVCAYAGTPIMQRAAIDVIFGEAPMQGKLPITIPGRYNFGDGIEQPQQYLNAGAPEEAGMDSKKLTSVDAIIEQGIVDSAYPGAVFLVARNGVVVYEKAYGKETFEPDGKMVKTNMLFDLASVSKVMGVTNAVMKLVGEGKLHLQQPVADYFPAFGQKGKEKITIYNLLVHNSGLPAWRKFYEFCDNPQCVMDSIFVTSLVYRTGDSTLYSDLGLITAGKIVERVTGKPLDRYVEDEFYKPLRMSNTMFNPPAAIVGQTMPTEIDTYWKKTGIAVHGVVHDENARILGGVSGHAGLFSTAGDLAILLQMLLNGGEYGGRQFLKPEIIRQFTTQQSQQSSRGIGWDTNVGTGRFTGSKLSSKTFMHTGFTGTSVVVDPEKKLIVVFLTNRVYPSRSHNGIARVRPRVHDAIADAIVR
jgi:beta-glucosidase-like glycosyl hydrolase/CubicO group peptidase (beta-lactamase class C family)